MKWFKNLWPSLLLIALVPYVMATSYPIRRWTTDQFITDGNGLVIGHTAQITSSSAAELQVLGTLGPDSNIIVGIWIAAANGPGFDFVKSNNTTIGAIPGTIVVDNDVIGAMRWFPDDGVDYTTQAATFRAEVDDATPAENDVGMAFVWLQMPGGGGAQAETMRLAANGNLTITADLILSGTPTLFINETTNANMTIGLTIHSAANDDGALAFKNSDVSHPMTGVIEDDTYGEFRKAVASSGGLIIRGFKDADGAAGSALILHGNLGEAADTIDTTAGRGVVEILASVTDGGTSIADVAATGNLWIVRQNNGPTHLIMKGNGDIHGSDSDGTEALDSHNDAALIQGLENYRVNSQGIDDFETMRASGMYDELNALGLLGTITAEEWNAGDRPLFNQTRERHLMRGNSRQEHGRMEAMLDVMEANNPAFRAAMAAAMSARGMSHLARQ